MKSSLRRKSVQLIRIAPGWLLRKVSNRQFLLIGAVVVGLWFDFGIAKSERALSARMAHLDKH